MTLVRFNNRPVARTFNSVFDELLNDFPGNWSKDASVSVPVNITESADAYQIVLNVPGRNKEDFKVSIENGLLTVSFEKKEETSNETSRSIRKEFSFNSFKRSFSLDEKINADKIEAKYENGLLSFNLPKKEEVKETPKQISIQ